MLSNRTIRLAAVVVLCAGPSSPATAQEILHTFNGNTIFELFGSSADSAGDVNGDGIPDVIGGAPRDSELVFWGGSASVFLGGVGTPWFTVFGSNKWDQLGAEVSRLGDVNADGFCDVLVGAPGFQAPGVFGLIRVVSGLDGSVLLDVPGPSWQTAYFALHLADAGDLNGDGLDDFATTDIIQDTAWVYSGADGSTLLTVPFPGAPGGCSSPNDISGPIGRLDDIDGDGAPDYVLATSDAGGALTVSGATGAVIYCLPGILGIEQRLGTTDDVDGDGVRDFLISAPSDSTFGQSTGVVRLHSGASGSLLHTIFGQEPDAGLGKSISGWGDIDGDGIPDLALGAPGSEENGKVYIHSGADASLLTVFQGGFHTHLGGSLANAGDVNGDGLSDLIVGANGTNNLTGAVHVYSGRCGTIEVFGTGCPGSGGIIPSFDTGDACANVGQPMTFTLTNALGGTTAFLLLGGGKGSVPLEGCTLLLQPVYPVVIPFQLGGAAPGEGATQIFAILPPSTAGQTISMQFFVSDLFGPKGYSASNAILIEPR